MPRSLSDRVRQLERDEARGKHKGKSFKFLENVNVVDFLERCEVANVSQSSADEVMFSCPFPGHLHGDESPSAYMNDGTKDKDLTTLYKCHGCGRSGNAISFLAEHQDIPRHQATRELKEVYAPGYTKPQGGIGSEFDKRRQLNKQRVIKPETPILGWDMYHDRFGYDWSQIHDYDRAPAWAKYILDRGFSPATLEHWGIGYDRRERRLAIPVPDPDGNLLGVKGRTLVKGIKPKYVILGDTIKRKRRGKKSYGFDPYEKSLVIFGLDEWGEVERYVFVEGELDVITLWMLGIPAICTGGAHCSDEQARLIREYCDEVVLFLDNDNAGSNGIWGYDDKHGEYHPGAIAKLSPFIRVKLVGKHRYDANDYFVKGKIDRLKRLIDNAKPHFVLQRPE